MSTKPHVPCLLLVALAFSAPGRAQDRAVFAEGLTKVRALMKRGSWKRAKSELDELLEAHARKGYALEQRVALEENMKQCVFRIGHPEPSPDDVVTGKIVRYDKRSGRIKLVYTTAQLADFETSENGFLTLPLTFKGTYSIQFEGKHYPTGAVQLYVAATNKSAYLVCFGHASMRAIVRRVAGSNQTDLGTDNSPAKIGKKYRVEVQVSRSRISLRYNRRKVLTVKKPDPAFGSFGFFDMRFDELAIEGVAQPSWIQGRIDAVQQEALAKFENTWRPSRYLPSWLLRAPAAKPLEIDDSYPGLLTRAQSGTIDRIHAMLRANGDYSEVLQFVRGLTDGKLPEITRTYIEALALESLGQNETALERYRSVCAQDPSFLAGQLDAARLLFELGRIDAGTKAFDRLIADHPSHWMLYQTYALALLDAGLPDKAKAVVDKGLERPRVRTKLGEMTRMLVMAKTGPRWSNTYEYESRHYHVLSDIDRRTCMAATKILEEALTIYRVRLGQAKIDRGKRFRVYLFSGEAGYKAYVADIIGGVSMHTAGLYSPRLKQLLIWNLPDRAGMMRTIRHEGFHQFLDLIAPDAPVWFNEGMAEYYETMKRDKNASLQGGQIRRDHLATLRKLPPLPLKRFFAMGGQEFYKHPERNYAQAWLTIHFLREHSADTRKIFKSLIDALQDGKSGERALQAALAGVDLASLEREYLGYLQELQ